MAGNRRDTASGFSQTFNAESVVRTQIITKQRPDDTFSHVEGEDCDSHHRPHRAPRIGRARIARTNRAHIDAARATDENAKRNRAAEKSKQKGEKNHHVT